MVRPDNDDTYTDTDICIGISISINENNKKSKQENDIIYCQIGSKESLLKPEFLRTENDPH